MSGQKETNIFKLCAFAFHFRINFSRLTVHALPVAILGARNKKVLATATVSGFSTTVLLKKTHVLVYETLKFHE